MRPSGHVAHVTFVPPTFAKTFDRPATFPAGVQTRYWSICATSDSQNDRTFVCLPDYLAKVAPDGLVHLVYGGEEMRGAALQRGFNFILDNRDSRLSSGPVTFVYRNLRPDPNFEAKQMYKGTCLLKGRLCKNAAFSGGSC